MIECGSKKVARTDNIEPNHTQYAYSQSVKIWSNVSSTLWHRTHEPPLPKWWFLRTSYDGNARLTKDVFGFSLRFYKLWFGINVILVQNIMFISLCINVVLSLNHSFGKSSILSFLQIMVCTNLNFPKINYANYGLSKHKFLQLFFKHTNFHQNNDDNNNLEGALGSKII